MPIKKKITKSNKENITWSKEKKCNSKMINYGTCKIPFTVRDKGLRITCKKDGSGLKYKRKFGDMHSFCEIFGSICFAGSHCWKYECDG